MLLCCCWRAAFMPTWCFCESWQREDKKIKTDGWKEKIEDKHRLKSNRYDWFQINNHRTFPSMQCSHLNGQVKHADCLITTVGRENHIWINLCWIWLFSGEFKYLQICCIHPSSTSYRDLRAAVWSVTHSCSQLLQFFCGDTRCSQTSQVTVSPACPLFASESPTGNTTSLRRHPKWPRSSAFLWERSFSNHPLCSYKSKNVNR